MFSIFFTVVKLFFFLWFFGVSSCQLLCFWFDFLKFSWRTPSGKIMELQFNIVRKLEVIGMVNRKYNHFLCPKIPIITSSFRFPLKSYPLSIIPLTISLIFLIQLSSAGFNFEVFFLAISTYRLSLSLSIVFWF